MPQKIGEFYYEITADNKLMLKTINESDKEFFKSGNRQSAHMDKIGKEISHKFNRYFSFGAMFGVGLSFAFTAVNKIMGLLGGGIQSAIDRNESLKQSIKELDGISKEAFEKLGENSLPILKEVVSFLAKIVAPKASGLPFGLSEKELKDTVKKLRSSMQEEINKKGYKVTDDPNSTYSYMFEMAEEAKRRLAEKAEEREQKADADRKKKADELLKAQNDFNDALNGTAGIISGMSSDSGEVSKEFKSIAGTAIGLIGNLKTIGEAMGKIKDESGEITPDKLMAFLPIGISILSVVIGIFDRINKINEISNRQVDAETKINRQLEYRKTQLEAITQQIERQKGIADQQDHVRNKTKKDYEDEIKTQKEILNLKEKQIKADKEIETKGGDANTRKQREAEIGKKLDSLDDEISKTKDLIDNSKDVLGNDTNSTKILKSKLSTLESMQSELKAQLKLLTEADAAEKDRLSVESDYRDIQEEIYSLQKEMFQSQVDQEESQISLLKAQSEYASDEEKAKYNEQIKDYINNQISQLQSELGIETNINDQLKTKTDIQNKMNELKTIETEEMEKQLELNKKLNLYDLENLNFIRSQINSLQSQGIYGVQALGQLSDMGISNQSLAMSGAGRTLNIGNVIANSYNMGQTAAALKTAQSVANEIGGKI